MTNILTEYLNELTENLVTTLNTPDAYLNKIVVSTLSIIAIILIYILFKKSINRNVNSIKKRFRFNKILKNAMIVLAIILILFIWIQAINALVLIALIGGAFTIVMLRGLTHNIIGYFVIKYRKYFKIGQRIELDDIIGDVIDINPISFTLLEVRNWLSSDSDTGRVIQVPNSIIFEKTIEIIGLENIFILHEIGYTLSFDSSWQEAESIMRQAGDLYVKETLKPSIEENSEYYLQNKEKIDPVFSLNTNELGIIVTLRYLVDYRNGTSVRTRLQREILDKFEGNLNIKFAVSDIRILEK